jgi:hypothetical protein
MPGASKDPATDERTLRYQKEAEKAREAARLTKFPSERETYLEIAKLWERLAEPYNWFKDI